MAYAINDKHNPVILKNNITIINIKRYTYYLVVVTCKLVNKHVNIFTMFSLFYLVILINLIIAISDKRRHIKYLAFNGNYLLFLL